MPSFTLQTQRRGSTLKIQLSLMRHSGDITHITSDIINVNNLALVAIRCKGNSDLVQFSVRMKKNDNAKVRAIPIKIVCKEFAEHIYLSDVWLETLIGTRSFNSDFAINSFRINHYLCIIQITVHEEMTMPLIVNNQLYEDQKSTDFHLSTADGTVAVHKSVLFIHSDMFRTMLNGEWKETREGQIKIDGVTVQTLQHLKDYMYLGTLPDDGLEPLLLIAAPYLMDKLKADCITKLVQSIKPENFDNIVQFAAENNIVELVRALIFDVPDEVVNNVHQLENSKNIEQE